jgi:hypothetical protein
LGKRLLLRRHPSSTGGTLQVHPGGSGSPAIDLKELVDEVRDGFLSDKLPERWVFCPGRLPRHLRGWLTVEGV